MKITGKQIKKWAKHSGLSLKAWVASKLGNNDYIYKSELLEWLKRKKK